MRSMGSRRRQSSTVSRARYRLGSSAELCGPMRYVTASMSVGPVPARARSTAWRVAAYTANTSLPSTSTPGMP